jgi:hypothetical protein
MSHLRALGSAVALALLLFLAGSLITGGIVTPSAQAPPRPRKAPPALVPAAKLAPIVPGKPVSAELRGYDPFLETARWGLVGEKPVRLHGVVLNYVVHVLNSLPGYQPRVKVLSSCPMDRGGSLELRFYYRHRKPVRIEAKFSGCALVTSRREVRWGQALIEWIENVS